MSKRFAITGIAGYIAPRHLKAIHETGNDLVAATDPHDSVGILDSFSLDTAFFREFERFDRHLEKLNRAGSGINYLAICSPNHLHDAHVRLALRLGADAICEKPLVLNPWNCEALQELEQESGRRIYTVLQLRLHPAIRALHERYAKSDGKHEIELSYITSRGRWYLYSWKGNREKSGGLATNIGIHFFDILLWLFGAPLENIVHFDTPTRTAGYLELERARVKWFLSIDSADLPAEMVAEGQRTYRSITIDGEAVEFSGGFTDLHTRVYEDILAGGGYGIDAARAAIELAHDIRHATPVGANARLHPLARGVAG